MGTTPRAPVQSPRRLPPTLTLIGASRTLVGDQDLDGGTVRWEGAGVRFQPLPCDPGFEPFVPGCGTMDLSGQARQGEDGAAALTLWAGVACSTSSSDLAAGATRARALLDLDRHRQLERGFWRGDAFQADPDLDETVTQWLARTGVVVELEAGVATGLALALTALQTELTDCGVGRGMIHATVRTAALWAAVGLVRREGALLLDVFDNVIVPGVGYDGSAPDGTVDASGDTAWAYATGIVDTRLGPVTDDATVDPATNDVAVIAQQSAMAYWDGCCHLGVNVDHTATGVTDVAV